MPSEKYIILSIQSVIYPVLFGPVEDFLLGTYLQEARE
jgi:hypothetical protein